jgi:type VI secretion system protein ImpL
LRATPFLRGFCFTGVRPVIVEEAGAVPADPAATRFFAPGVGFPSAPPPSARIPGVRRAPDWVFLRNFVAKVILGDRAARGTSGSDTRAALIRRFLWGTAAAAALAWLTGATVSYANLHRLAARAAGASRALANASVPAGQPPSAEVLGQWTSSARPPPKSPPTSVTARR